MTDATPSAGATPAAADATSTQSSPAATSTAVTTAPPATTTATDDGIGEAGKRAIQAERQAAKEADKRAQAAEAELETLRATTQTDHERQLTAAKREATAEVKAAYEAKLLRADLRARLNAAGVASDVLVELALKADTFAGVKLDDDGRVIDGDKLVAKLKEEAPELFGGGTAAAPNGAVTAGAQTSTPAQPKSLEDAVTQHYSAKH